MIGIAGRKRTIWTVAAVVVPAVALASALAWAVAGSREPTTEVATVTIYSPLNDQSIPVAARSGIRFAITLPANRTTGYSWRIAGTLNSKTLKLIESTYKESGGTALGRGGSEVWTFEAVAKGSQTLTMEYARPWEKNVKPAKSQAFAVAVQ